ncbi:MAG: hypothetical protein KUG77_11380 [Nannocystaceae bacterium]|nr:hypothetical protein [Nannocystaceae bacterium]
MRRLLWSSTLCALALSLAGCPSEDEPAAGDKKEGKKETKKEEGEQDDAGSLMVAEGDGGVDGPVPPEVSMVFFSVEGALYPLACFDKDAKSIKTGAACMKMVKPGDAVRVASHDSQYNKTAGEPAEPQCLAGSGKKVAIGVEGITQGADFLYGTWPPAGIKVIKEVDEDSTGAGAVQIGDEETSKLKAAVKSAGGTVRDELKVHQVAEVHGLTEKDKVYSVYVPDPKVLEQYKWSGAFLAEGGSLDKLTLIAKSKSKKDVFEVRGSMDLEGDKVHELWMRIVFAEGSGDRIYKLSAGKVEAIGKWSCGAVR